MSKKIIDHVDYDQATGLPFIVDCQGNKYLMAMIPRNYNRVYLNAYDKGPWPNVTDYHSLTCDMCGGAHSLEYQVPTDQAFYIAFLIAAQESKNAMQNAGVSLLGMFINNSNTPILFVPFSREISYVLFEPMRLVPNTKIEVKYKPFSTDCTIGILVGGYLHNPNAIY